MSRISDLVRENIKTGKWAFDFMKRKLIIELCDECDFFEEVADDFAQENEKLKQRETEDKMKKKHKEKIKQFLCGLTVHRYRKMHFKYKKKNERICICF